MNRRQFLQRAGLLGGAAVVGGPTLLRAAPAFAGEQARGLLELPAREAPIDTVVVVLMENRSFDHYFGWLAGDERYIERGKRRHGRRFHVDGKPRQEYPAPDGTVVATAPWLESGDPNPFRGCGHPDPGHGWTSGRAQRDGGFLADGSGNDAFALGYYGADGLPFLADLAREFTVFDHWHASLLTSTYPNRAYLHSGQSGGYTSNQVPVETGGYDWPTIWDRLGAAGVPAAYYHTDLPTVLLWGNRLTAFDHPIDDYFAQAATGELPNVVFVDPAFLSGNRTDDHPHADIRAGQRFMRDVFRAFAQSRHWKNGLFVVTYDEWGGFFDHVPPPMLPDDRASAIDAENFGQAGFRVPAVMASPFARRGFVDHGLYDHTSVLRFLEWRFLGAPPKGPGKDGDTWFLTTRDRNARNLGASLVAEAPERAVDIDVDLVLDPPSEPCPEDGGPPLPPAPAPPAASVEKHSFEIAMDEGYFERLGYDVRPSPMAREWAPA